MTTTVKPPKLSTSLHKYGLSFVEDRPLAAAAHNDARALEERVWQYVSERLK
jgi:hypothetical protein